MKNEAVITFKRHTAWVCLVIKFLDLGNSTGIKGVQPAFGRVPVWFNSVLKFLTVIEQGSPCFHFVLGKSFSFLLQLLKPFSQKTFRGEGWPGGHSWDYGMEGFWVLMAAPGWLRMMALGSWVRPQQHETAGQANLGGPSPQEGGIILVKYRQNWGHWTETAPAPNLSTEQPGFSETLIKPILKQKKWIREEEMNEEYLGRTLMMFHL